ELALADEHVALLLPRRELLPLLLHHDDGCAGHELRIAQLALLRAEQPGETLHFRPQPAALAADVDRVAQRDEDRGAVGEHRVPAHPLGAFSERELRHLGQAEYGRPLPGESAVCRSAVPAHHGPYRPAGPPPLLRPD